MDFGKYKIAKKDYHLFLEPLKAHKSAYKKNCNKASMHFV